MRHSPQWLSVLGSVQVAAIDFDQPIFLESQCWFSVHSGIWVRDDEALSSKFVLIRGKLRCGHRERLLSRTLVCAKADSPKPICFFRSSSTALIQRWNSGISRGQALARASCLQEKQFNGSPILAIAHTRWRDSAVQDGRSRFIEDGLSGHDRLRPRARHSTSHISL